MNKWTKKAGNIMKNEAVLCVAVALAIVSVFLQPVDREYVNYIDWNTLMLLFCLMAVMAGFQKLGLFQMVGNRLLGSVKTTRSLLLILSFLPFFFSMLITNDVALITFVPFGIVVLHMSGKEELLIPLVVLQTIGANMGSSLTPVGNPQNLYLYGQSGASLMDFIRWMLPYTVVTGIFMWITILFQKKDVVKYVPTSEEKEQISGVQRISLICYGVIFAACLFSVAKIIPPVIVFITVLAYLLIFDRKLLPEIDYALLGTFFGFFIFIGNLGRLPAFRDFFASVLTGHETLVGVLSSQIISNVPAALLLSGFTDQWKSLVVGTNLGGLGTLIASMASLISYKQITRQYPEKKDRYFLWFTVGNLGMLLILLGVYKIL